MDHSFGALLARLVILIIASAGVAFASSYEDNLSGFIGSHNRIFAVSNKLGPHSPSEKNKSGYIAITEVYPDKPGCAEYHYTVSGSGLEYERRRRGIGFGPETFFIKTSQPVNSLSIRSASANSAPVFSSSGWWVVSQKELDTLLAADRFRVLGLVHPEETDAVEGYVKMLADGIRPKARYGIGIGFSAEIRFANRSEEKVLAEIKTCADLAAKYNIPVFLGWVSWWSGTPVGVPDSEGGKFSDIKYQQICYAPKTELPEDEALKALLGDRYDTHYCLSVPNQWSNTPWLTMNSAVLNQYRYKRLDEAVAMLQKQNGGDLGWIEAFYLENEPRYWDTLCDDGNSKRELGELWADFNPLVVEAAKEDGVDLNPADGLSSEELTWLFRNVGVYNQECVDAVNNSMSKYGIKKPVYTHSLQHRYMFPGDTIGHPASEWAYADRARAGLEGLWSHPSDFARVREWGRWANINREENDGHHTDVHLWDLRVCYMMGGDLYNSYNWYCIGAQRVIDYINEFITELPVVTLPPAESAITDGAVTIKTPMKLQAFDRLTLPLQTSSSGTANLRIVDTETGFLASSSVAVSAGSNDVVFDFPTPVELPYSRCAVLKLQIVDSKGREVDYVLPAGAESHYGIKLALDLRQQRALSLAAIARAESIRPTSP
ncbi:MAG: hypothetical protein ACOX3G_00515 [Armatimonadota bacterium]